MRNVKDSILKRLNLYKQYVVDEISAKEKTSILFNINRIELNKNALTSVSLGISNEKLWNDRQLIVSLTSYGKRLYDVYLSIESIMQQSLKPNKIILWLADNLKNVQLPITLQNQVKRGLEIKYCKDLLSYKKLIPSLKMFPEDVIITIDDDIIYRFDLIENLVNAYNNNPENIYCTRMHRMRLSGTGKLKPYSDWEWEVQDNEISVLNFPTGGAGTLYPPYCFNSEVLNDGVFMKICRKADDVWFKAMALFNGVQAQKVVTNADTIIFSDNGQDIALSNSNVFDNGNDMQIEAVFEKYNLYERLKG